MSLYNMLFSENPIANVLKASLDLDTPNGWSTGRYRDIYMKDNKIVLYTRNGGGNRECWQEDKTKNSADCGCSACVMRYILPNHPKYLKDYDDDFDITYAYIEFDIPDVLKDLIDKLEKAQGDTDSVSDKFLKNFK